MYQSFFYQKYWNQQIKSINVKKDSSVKPTYFIEISEEKYDHSIIIKFTRNTYKIIIIKRNNIIICESLYNINWEKTTEIPDKEKTTGILGKVVGKAINVFKVDLNNFIINETNILNYIKQVVDNQKIILENFFYFAADFSYPKLNEYKNFKQVTQEPNIDEIHEIPLKFANNFSYYKNEQLSYITADNELAKYIYNEKKKNKRIKYYKFNSEIFISEPDVKFYRGMELNYVPLLTNDILKEKPFLSITRNKEIALGFMYSNILLPKRKASISTIKILYEITLEKGVQYIDFKILGEKSLFPEEELLLFTTCCTFRYEELIPPTTINNYYICKVSISVTDIVELERRYKKTPDIKRFKELKIDDSFKSESFNISSSQSNIESDYKLTSNVPVLPTNQESNILYEETNAILKHNKDNKDNKHIYIIYKRTDIEDESVYICIDNTYYEVSGKIIGENKKIINKKITHKIITDGLNENSFVYLNKYSALCKTLGLIKFEIIYNTESLSKEVIAPDSNNFSI